MKKVFPFIIFIFLSIFLLTSEFFTRSQSSNASSIIKSKEKSDHYEKLFSEIAVKIDDENIKFSEIKAPVVILNFWASWCVPCIKEFPSLVSLRKKFKQNELFILGINNDEGKQEKIIKKAEKEYNLNFKSVADKGSYITTEKFLITDIPVSIVFVKGKVKEISLGDKDFMNPDLIKLITENQN